MNPYATLWIILGAWMGAVLLWIVARVLLSRPHDRGYADGVEAERLCRQIEERCRCRRRSEERAAAMPRPSPGLRPPSPGGRGGVA